MSEVACPVAGLGAPVEVLVDEFGVPHLSCPRLDPAGVGWNPSQLGSQPLTPGSVGAA